MDSKMNIWEGDVEENNRVRQVESMDVSSKKQVLKLYEMLHKQQQKKKKNNQAINVELGRIFWGGW